MNNISKDRIKWIDSLKGFTIILVVLQHVVAGFNKAGILYNGVIEDNLVKCIGIFHMPLFMTISGYVFALVYTEEDKAEIEKGVNRIGLVCSYKKQVYNLFALYFIFSILMFIFKYLFHNYINTVVGWNDLIKLPIRSMPGTPYWYLYVLAIIYVVTVLFLKLNWNEKVILGIAFVTCIVYQLLNLEVFFTMQYVFYYFFYFFLGCVFQIRGKVLIYSHFLIQALIILFGSLSIWSKKDDLPVSVIGALSALLATLIINLLFIFFKKYLDCSGILKYLGERSLEIYVLHIYVTSGSRPILKILHMENYFLNVFILTFFGIILPLIGSYILKKLKLWDMFFKPVQYWQKIYDKYKNK